MTLFAPFTLRGVIFRNRIGVSPMCEYASINGYANDWHLVHLGSRAVGGAGLVMTEAAAVQADGRISPQDLGIYEDGQIEMLARIAHFVESQGAVPGIQLAHAGRKASVARPWDGGRPLRPEAGGWSPVLGASPLPFDEGWAIPHELSIDEIARIVGAFAESTRRAVRAGFRVIEIHGAHGYLVHSFLSPFSHTYSNLFNLS